MDNNLPLRFELNNLVNQWVDNVIRENGISYAMMEDALNACLIRIKDEVFKEYLNAMSQAAMAAQQAQQNQVYFGEPPTEDLSQETEVSE